MKLGGNMKSLKKILVLLFLFTVTINTFSQVHETGRMLIMGWAFEEKDTSLQTNIAINAILSYVEAAKYQMMSEERYNPSFQIELYRNINFYEPLHEGVFIYINSRDTEDYFDRFIEINFYIRQSNWEILYKLVLNYNNYNWLKNNDESDMWEFILNGEPAYNFFISWLELLRR